MLASLMNQGPGAWTAPVLVKPTEGAEWGRGCRIPWTRPLAVGCAEGALGCFVGTRLGAFRGLGMDGPRTLLTGRPVGSQLNPGLLGRRRVETCPALVGCRREFAAENPLPG